MSRNLGLLESTIGHQFKDRTLLERALTHRSWAFENDGHSGVNSEPVDNESIEFLGDSVLGLVVAEHLFNKHLQTDEGGLTLMKHSLVSTATLAIVAERLKLGEYLRVGRGEEKTGGRKKQALLANTLEAVIGAVFHDAGYSGARVFITTTFRAELGAATPENSIDYKTTLDRKSTRLNSSHIPLSRMPSSA